MRPAVQRQREPVLAELRRRGITVRLAGDVLAVKGTLTHALAAKIRANRDAIIAALRDERDGLSPIAFQIRAASCVRCFGDRCRHCGWSGYFTVRGRPS